jgi:thiamine-phosphate pyrophosphorylase
MPSALYAVVDVDVAARAGWDARDLARAYMDGGASWIQVRAKRLASGAFLGLCDAVVRAARSFDTVVVVNDRADLARMSGAAGVHVGQADLPPRGARVLLGPSAVVGVSTHTVAQIDAARLEPVSYVAVGPVFGTATKDTGYDAVGLALVREARARTPAHVPIVAIGGITLELAPSVIAAGASQVAVIGDLLASGDPRARAAAFRRALM